MFKLLLSGTIGAMLALALVIAGLATWCTANATYHFERMRLAQEVRGQYQMLDAMADAILREAAQAGARFQEDAARGRIAAQFEVIRQAHLAELGLTPLNPAEGDELHHLAALEVAAHAALTRFGAASAALAGDSPDAARASFEALLGEAFGAEFHEALATAIRRETAEAAATEAEAREALAMVGQFAQAGAVLAVLVAAGSLVLLIRRLQRPLDRLVQAAHAVAAGEFDRRIEPGAARGEFAPVARSFNAMIDQVARARTAHEQARDALEQSVATRTAELAAANATLRHGDEVRRRFLADVSHELRTPLTVIRGEAEIALRGANRPPEDYRRALARIAEETALTAHLVDDLLFVARSEAGEARLARHTVAFDEVVRRAAAAARTLAAPRQVRVIERACAVPAIVQGDPERLRQLVLILLDNAVRYSESGGDVTLTLAPAADGVVLSVADQGIGIPPEEIDRVFERFHRGDRAATRHPEGSGLGLPLARAIARAHGGEVTLESHAAPDNRPGAGSGTTARLRLPLAPRLEAAA